MSEEQTVALPILASHSSEENTERQVFLVAESPAEMQQAQSGMVCWMAGKLRTVRAEIRDLQMNLKLAVEHKWRVSGLRSALNRAKQRQTFYEKVKAALEAGYCVIPNLDADIFAIRVKRSHPIQPAGDETEVPDEDSQKLPVGEGRYVSPQQTGRKFEEVIDGRKTKMFNPLNFQEAEFPLEAAEPRILSAAGRAQAAKIFDELGIVREGQRGDPMIVGRVVGPGGGRWSRQHQVTFVICWFVDLRRLVR